jgi:hypothetical protein
MKGRGLGFAGVTDPVEAGKKGKGVGRVRRRKEKPRPTWPWEERERGVVTGSDIINGSNLRKDGTMAADHVQLFINGALVYEQQASGAPVTPPDPQPPIPPTPVGPPIGQVMSLGAMSATGGPSENSIPNMVPEIIFVRSQDLSQKTGYVNFQSGYLSGYELPDFSSWISAAPGTDPIAVPGCEVQRLMGSNISSHVVAVAQLISLGYTTVYFNVQAHGWTGRYMQRTP